MTEQDVKTVVQNQITPRHLYEAAILIAVALVIHAYISTLVNTGKVQQVRQDVAPIHQEAAAEKKSATESEVQNQRDLTAALKTIADQRQQPIQSPVDYARIEAMIQAKIGGTAQVTSTPGLPNAPSATVSATNLRDYMSDCDSKTVELSSCKKTVIDTQALLAAEIKDHKADKTELDATRIAMKGGSFWHRFNSNKNWMIGGAVVGTVGGVLLTSKLNH